MRRRMWTPPKIPSLAGLAAALILFSGITACGSTDQGGASGDSLKAIKDKGTITVGVRRDQQPFSFKNKGGDLVGFEVDIARRIADKMGVDLELKSVTSETRIPALQQGRVDLVAGTMSHYRDREQQIDFSVGYFWSPRQVLVSSDSGLDSLGDLQGATVATTAGAGTLDELPQAVSEVEMETANNYQDAFLSLQQGAIDGVATDRLTLAQIVNNSDNPEAYTFIQEPYGASAFAIGLRENASGLRDFVNVALQDMWANGTWERLFNKWFGSETAYGMKPSDLNWEMPLWSVPWREKNS